MQPSNLYIQFYSSSVPSFKKIFTNGKYVTSNEERLVISNGLSNVTGFCNDNGKMLWVKNNVDWFHCFEPDVPELPIEDIKKVYVSSFYYQHLWMVYEWGKKYPHMDFIVGGPCIARNTFADNLDLPNVRCTKNSITDELNIEREEWNIQFGGLPIKDDTFTLLSMACGTNCYWRGCKFCNYYSKEKQTPLCQDSFKKIEDLGRNVVVYLSPSSAESVVLESLPDIKTKAKVFMFIRPDRKTVEILERVLPKLENPKQFIFAMGLEYPSDKILRFLNKGFTLDEFMKCYNLLEKYGCIKYILTMLGLNSITEEDVDSCREWSKTISDDATLQIRKTILIHGTRLCNDTPEEEKQKFFLGPFDLGYLYKLEGKTKELNDESLRIFYERGFKFLYDGYNV